MTDSPPRPPDDPLARYEEEIDPFSVDDPAAAAREERRRERERRRAEREKRGNRRRSLGRRASADGDGVPPAPAAPPPAHEPAQPGETGEAEPAPHQTAESDAVAFETGESAPVPHDTGEAAAAPYETAESAAIPSDTGEAAAVPSDPGETAAVPDETDEAAALPYDTSESSAVSHDTAEGPARRYSPPPRPPALGPPPAAGARGPSGAAVWRRRALALVLVAIVAAIAWLGFALFQPFAGDGSGKVVVEIPKGATASEIADLLEEEGVVSSSSLFRLRLTLAGKGDDIAAGNYTLANDMSYGAAIDALSKAPGTTNIVMTVPEGYTLEQIADLAADSGLEGDYEKAASGQPKGFDPGEYGAGGAGSLEGFLFPATYELDPDSTAEELVGQQLAAFEGEFKKVDMSYAESKNLDAYDVLTIASMIEREVQVASERELVAAVIYNRLGSGEPLGIDATLRYALDNFDKPLTQSDLATDTPYNTRLVAGLPPTPIGNPGLAAIEAAANPAKVDYRFYVVKPGTCGEHVFTASEAEFEQAAADYQAALEAEGGSPTEC